MSLLEFKQIPGFSAYRVNKYGKIWSDKRNRFLKPTIQRGYKGVYLTSDKGGQKNKKVHQLMAMAFLGHKPDGTTRVVVDHVDNNPLNNRLDNLQLISNRENVSKDKWRKGLPLHISKGGDNCYRFQVVNTIGKGSHWKFSTLENALEMKAMYEQLKEWEGIDRALEILKEVGRSKKTEKHQREQGIIKL